MDASKGESGGELRCGVEPPCFDWSFSVEARRRPPPTRSRAVGEVRGENGVDKAEDGVDGLASVPDPCFSFALVFRRVSDADLSLDLEGVGSEFATGEGCDSDSACASDPASAVRFSAFILSVQRKTLPPIGYTTERMGRVHPSASH